MSSSSTAPTVWVASRDEIPEINRILNDPYALTEAGRKMLGAGKAVDIATAWDRVLVIRFSKSLLLFEIVGDECLCGHVAILPDDRGELAIRATKRAIAMLFLTTPMRWLTAKVVREGKRIHWFAGTIGMKPGPTRGQHTVWSLSLEDWLLGENLPKTIPKMRSIARKHGQIRKFHGAQKRVFHALGLTL